MTDQPAISQSRLERHRLQPLLAPRSVAIVGASARVGSFGHTALWELVNGGFGGAIYPINPRYDQIDGYPCFPSFDALDESPDLAVMSVANERLEGLMEDAAAAGVRAATIFASGQLQHDDPQRPLLSRLQRIASEAGMSVCGGNCMGFRNLSASVHASVFGTTHDNLIPGPVALVSHSGTGFGELIDNDRRMGFTLAVSAGQEIVTSAADYLDYALANPQTRCVAMFLEQIRDPDGFRAALAQASRQKVPVVVVKVGRSAASARFALSHSGAMVGNDAAYEALFQREGVVRVDTLEELVNAVQLLAYGRPLPAGGLAAGLDSGGKRELLVDLAHDAGVPLASINEATAAAIAPHIDHDHEAINPLDYWGTGGPDWGTDLRASLCALADDPDTALCVIASAVTWNGRSGYADVLVDLAQATRKPVGILSDFVHAHDLPAMARLNAVNIPVLLGARAGLRAIRAVLDYRDFLSQPSVEPPAAPYGVADKWRSRLQSGGTLEEAAAYALLADYGIATPPAELVETEADLMSVIEEIGYPVVLKTAMPGISHKSDVGGVKLELREAGSARAAYQDLSQRLGPKVLVVPHADLGDGIEMAIGTVRDPLLGHLLMIGFGGTLVEWLDDKVCVPAPSDPAEVERAIARLRTRRLLGGVRGRAPVDVDALIDAAVKLSVLVADLEGAVSEIDINPLLVRVEGCIALDALVVPVTR